MRITKIEIENLNSLKGYWCIDFLNPDYKKNHDLFVICGETGAGKTTILDAITLALYGRTPRQSDFSQSGNELMTRNTAYCMARVSYTCKSGSYVSEFSQKRARGKSSGNLQKTECRIQEAETGTVIWTGVSTKLEDESKKYVQLDYEQFCRSIMLAQGEFDKFIKGDERSRATILAKLSGTEKYKEIGRRVCEKAKEANGAFKNAREIFESAKAEILSAGEVEEKQKEQNESRKKIAALDKRLGEIQEALNRQKIYGDFILKSGRKKEIQEKFSAAEADAKASGGAFDRKKEEEKEFLVLLKKVRELDVNIKNAAEKYARSKKISDEAKAKIDAAVEDKKRLEEEIENLKKDLLDSENYLNENKKDTEIPSVTAAMRQEAKTLQDCEKKIENLETDFKKAEKENALLCKEKDLLEEKIKKLDEKLRQFFEKNYISIAAFLRAGLSAEKPCPVCGSATHPYCREKQNELFSDEGREPALNAVEIQKDYEKAKENLLQAKNKIEGIQKESGRLKEQSDSEKENRKKIIGEINAGLLKWNIKIEGEKSCAPQIDRAESLLKERLDSYVKKQQSAEACKNNLAKCNAENDSIKIEELKKDYAALLSETEKDFLGQKKFEDERTKLFGKKDADWEEKEFNAALKAVEEKKNSDEQNKSRWHDALTEIDSEIKLLEGQLKDYSGAEPAGEKSKDELLAEQAGLEGEKNLEMEKSSRIKILLEQNLHKEKALVEIEKNYARAAEENADWMQMKEFVGISDGSDFEVFVQGLIFENLLRRADKYLRAISGRYEFSQIKNRVDFMIRDINFSGANELRPVSNMSGGEKFIISLSLALGIAELASRNVRVDSLFLDEGFGTLSGRPLIEAVNALKQLQNSGKMLGIITHVENVINEFDQKIKVEKVAGGISVLKGSGIIHRM